MGFRVLAGDIFSERLNRLEHAPEAQGLQCPPLAIDRGQVFGHVHLVAAGEPFRFEAPSNAARLTSSSCAHDRASWPPKSVAMLCARSRAKRPVAVRPSKSARGLLVER